ncbi:hypothetical protein TNCT_408711 [Trichonephila clavata]|uniref:Uncharacterized protein n=1 Tax=Trichonephila clavata TaxID=2740835 RepID=A0A8X6I6N3_TRICU|nr:hypothetical protein TNCT_408711 [Trichonephila clavata]
MPAENSLVMHTENSISNQGSHSGEKEQYFNASANKFQIFPSPSTSTFCASEKSSYVLMDLFTMDAISRRYRKPKGWLTNSGIQLVKRIGVIFTCKRELLFYLFQGIIVLQNEENLPSELATRKKENFYYHFGTLIINKKIKCKCY